MNRSEYIEDYINRGEQTLTNEKLPTLSEILDYSVNGKTSTRLNRVFNFFDDEEEFKSLVTRDSTDFSEEESYKFVDSVVAANVTEISDSGSLYKKLMASGDSLRIKGNNCNSKGRKILLPISEEEFKYSVVGSYCSLDNNNDELLTFNSYDDFKEVTSSFNSKYIHVRSPLHCKHARKKACCPVCAGILPNGIQNLGAFSTLMVTETATQNALSSMNKGKKENINFTLAKKPPKSVNNFRSYKKWANEIADSLMNPNVERRFYEIVLVSRLDTGSDTFGVNAIGFPRTKDYLGMFIYRPNKTSYRSLISQDEFIDNSLKGQIAFNSYKKGVI